MSNSGDICQEKVRQCFKNLIFEFSKSDDICQDKVRGSEIKIYFFLFSKLGDICKKKVYWYMSPNFEYCFFFISRLTSFCRLMPPFLEICKHLFFFSMPQLPSFQIFRQVLKFEKIKFLSHWLTTFFWHLSPNFNIVFVLSHWLTSFCRLKTPFLEIL